MTNEICIYEGPTVWLCSLFHSTISLIAFQINISPHAWNPIDRRVLMVICCSLSSRAKFMWSSNSSPFRGKLRRILGQFGPYVWVDYDWKPLSSLGRWFYMLGIIAIVRITSSPLHLWHNWLCQIKFSHSLCIQFNEVVLWSNACICVPNSKYYIFCLHC